MTTKKRTTTELLELYGRMVSEEEYGMKHYWKLDTNRYWRRLDRTLNAKGRCLELLINEDPAIAVAITKIEDASNKANEFRAIMRLR